MRSVQLLDSNNGPTASSSRQGPKPRGTNMHNLNIQHMSQKRGLEHFFAGAPGASASNGHPTMEAKQCGRAFDNVSRIKKRSFRRAQRRAMRSSHGKPCTKARSSLLNSLVLRSLPLASRNLRKDDLNYQSKLSGSECFVFTLVAYVRQRMTFWRSGYSNTATNTTYFSSRRHIMASESLRPAAICRDGQL